MRRLDVEPVQAGPAKIEVVIDGGAHGLRLSFGFSVPAAATGDFALPLTLLPSMARGAPLHVDSPVDPGLLERQQRIQAQLAAWSSRFSRIAVDAPERPPPESAPGGVGAFFSGGVDSFHTLLTRREEITHLILIHGFDYGHTDRDFRRRVAEMARNVGGALDLEVIEVETDAKERALPLVPWNWYHGSLLAGIGQALEQHVARVLIPATHALRHQRPWGQHPDLDPLWSTARVEVETAGAATARIEKSAVVGESDLAMRWLRVCWQSRTEWNCGRCEKCMRTMIGLEACGALGRCETLPHTIDTDAVRALVLRTEGTRQWAHENLDRLRASDKNHAELAAALEHALSRARYRAARQRLTLVRAGAMSRARVERDKLRIRFGRSTSR